jgi:hypothetical protein
MYEVVAPEEEEEEEEEERYGSDGQRACSSPGIGKRFFFSPMVSPNLLFRDNRWLLPRR